MMTNVRYAYQIDGRGRTAEADEALWIRGLIEQVGSQETLPIIEARLHRKARNLVSARDRGNLQIVAAMQEEVVNLTELRVRMERWLDEYEPAAYSSAGNLMS